MDLSLVLKAGFMGFALSLGAILLVFYIVGTFLNVSRRHFVHVFVLAAVASFVAVDVYLYYKIRIAMVEQSQLFLVGCIGGWLGGIFFGLINMRRFLNGTLK